MFPSPVEPPVLAGVVPYELLNCFGIFCSNPSERIVLISPFLRENNAITGQFEEKSIINSSAAANYYRQVIGNS
jgi:hypothetical protein